MPELPEVEAVTRKLRRDGVGAVIGDARVIRRRITAPSRPDTVERRLRERRITAVDRRGKSILIRLDDRSTLHVHLRMTGNLYVIPDGRLRPHPLSAWLDFEDGRSLVFEDPRGLGTFRLLDEEECARLESLCGPEPLSKSFTSARFVAMAKSARQPAKLFLMDQRRVAGLGNIYAAEALYESRIDPRQKICDVSSQKLVQLHGSIVQVLRSAVKFACIAYTRPGGLREAEDYSPAVYDREGEPCLRCGRAIVRIKQGGRSTYFCPRCQR